MNLPTKQAHTIISADTLQAIKRIEGVSSGQLEQLGQLRQPDQLGDM